MPQARSRDSENPILNSPYEESAAHYATDQAGNLNYDDAQNRPIPTADEDEAVYRGFIRAQESSMRRFWEETKDDNL